VSIQFSMVLVNIVIGRAHSERHLWWKEAMVVLLDLWGQFEQRSKHAYEALRDSVVGFEEEDSNDKKLGGVSVDGDEDKSSKSDWRRVKKNIDKRKKRCSTVDKQSFIELKEAFEDKIIKRKGWRDRCNDSIFKTVKDDEQPMSIPFPVVEVSIEELEEMVEEISLLEKRFAGK
jgi:FTO C-terminal domain